MGHNDNGKLFLDHRSRAYMFNILGCVVAVGCLICLVVYIQIVTLSSSNNLEVERFLASLGEKRSSSMHAGMSSAANNKPIVKYNKVPYSSEYPSNIYTTLLDVITRWNPDEPDVPDDFVETLAHFNYSDPVERAMAEGYRNAEVPFKLYDVPEFAQVSIKWTDAYLGSAMRHLSPHVEKSRSNHFMYWNMNRNGLADYSPPTEVISDMKFEQWLTLARAADEWRLGNDTAHFYFMTGCTAADRGTQRNFVAQDLTPFVTPVGQPNFFITSPEANKGIQCRFGMRGIIAESHYDSGRNMIALLKGHKRYIINPPSECPRLGILTAMTHPSYRHSVFDWSDTAQAKAHGFDRVAAIDTVVRVGEVLYLPSYWFHYVVSLDYSIQCNSRSGTPPNREGEADIEACMGKSSVKKSKDRKKLRREKKQRYR